MACLEMYNSDQHKGGNFPPNSPRISFSNDFADSQQILNQEIRNDSEVEFSSDFEFSVSNYSMMSADELFFKGRLLPFNNSNSNQTQSQRTIRDELLCGDDEDDNGEISVRPPKGSSGSNRWKGLLGLKRANIGSKKIENNRSSTETRFHPANNSQEFMSNSEGGSSHRDVEIGIYNN